MSYSTKTISVKIGDTFTAEEFRALIAQGYTQYSTPNGYIARIEDAIPLNPDCVSVTWTASGWRANGVTPISTHFVSPTSLPAPFVAEPAVTLQGVIEPKKNGGGEVMPVQSNESQSTQPTIDEQLKDTMAVFGVAPTISSPEVKTFDVPSIQPTVTTASAGVQTQDYTWLLAILGLVALVIFL